MLNINNITVQYGNKNPSIVNLSMDMKPGEIVSIVGESGSGKTTLIRSIMGLLPAGGKITNGDIVFNGKSLLSYSMDDWNKIRGTELSMIFQDCGAMINPIRKIGNQFIEYIRTHEKMSKEEASKKAINMLEQMMLSNPDNIMKSYPFQLSGGMRQRVGIAMAMTFSPKLLIADEPTSALDVTTQSQIIRNMLELREKFNTGIIMVTHNLAIAAYISDKIIVMKDGKIVEQGSRDNIINNPKDEYTKELLNLCQIGRRNYMSKSKNILEIRNVTKKFNTPNNKVLTACDNISLEFEEGKILAIVGESGCGKSTLMKMIVQLENVTSGEILYEGEDITKLKGEKLRQNRRHIQMVFQDPNTSFNPRMKVRDIICEPLLNFGLIKKNQRDDIAKEFLEMVDLPKDFSNRYIHNMSGGQRQRIGIARALTLNPKVVIFDESTSALDVLTQKKIIDLIIKLQKKKILL